MSNLFRVKNGLNLSPVDLTTLTSPQAGDLACDINDLNKIKRYDANTLGWTEVGSGGGVGNVNALLTQTFDTAALAQFTQTGLALTTTNPIDGTQSARLIHQAASSQSFKQVIAVDRKYRGDLMAMSLQVRSSATSGNLTLLVTDETNSAVIMASSSISTDQYQVATAVTNTTTTISGFSNVDINSLKVGMTITGSGIPTATVISSINTAANTIVISQAATASATITAKFSALPDRKSFSFVIPTNCASLSYTVTALQEAGLPESYVDDVVIELANVSLLETSVTVPNLTAWQGYTPTFTGFGTVTSPEFEWRQVGENVEIRGKFTGGTSTAVEARISLPNGYTSAGTGIIPSIQLVGHGTYSAAFASSAEILIEPSVTYVTLSLQDSSRAGLTKQNGSVILGAGNLLSLFASVPCAGLTASSSTSIPLTQSGLVQEADSSIVVVGALSYGSVNTSVVNFPTVLSSVGASVVYNNSSTLGTSFTILKTGVYSITAYLGTATSTAIQDIGITKNSPSLNTSVSGIPDSNMLQFSRDTINTAAAGTKVPSVSWTGILQANDIIRIQGALTIIPTSGMCTITYQGSLKQVSVNTNSKITIPTSELRFEGASARGSTDTAIVKFDTQAKIRGDAFSVVNTAANGTVVTMLKKGRLVISASSYFGATAASLTISKNQAVLTSVPSGPEAMGVGGAANANYLANAVTAPLDVQIGDIFRVSASAALTANTASYFHLSFQEQEIQVSVSNTLPQFSESDTYAKLAGNAGQVMTVDVTNIPFITILDTTNGGWNGSQFTVSESGTYNFTGSAYTVAAITRYVDLYINGVFSKRVSDSVSTTVHLFHIQDYYSVGDIISFRFGGNGATLSNVSTYHYLNINKVGKPNVTGVNVTPFVNVPFEKAAVGEITAFAGNIDGSYYLDCNGAAVNRGTYSQLFAAIGTTYGVGDGSTTFNIPDFRGVFLRGLDGGRGLDTGRVLGTYQADVIGSHVHPLKGGNAGAAGPYTTLTSGFSTQNQTLPDTFANTGAGAETRPKNVAVNYGIRFKTATDTILTASETFSTDTAALTYAGSGTYTLSTLANAPVGTFITFTITPSTNAGTQTTTAPTQTTADMNANGILLTGRAFNATSTAAAPAMMAIQIGKGFKGKQVDGYNLASKVTALSLDIVTANTTVEYGTGITYSEKTGILTLDAGTSFSGTSTTRGMGTTLGSAVSSGYLVVNASKNPALTGLGLNRIAARGVNTAGTSIAAALTVDLTYDTIKSFDTNGALNSATGVFTAPETGYYEYSAVSRTAFATVWAADDYYRILSYKNGIQIGDNLTYISIARTMALASILSDVVFLNKNDTLSIKVEHGRSAAVSLDTTAGSNYFSVTKVSI